jgi:hypothetical protein
LASFAEPSAEDNRRLPESDRSDVAQKLRPISNVAQIERPVGPFAAVKLAVVWQPTLKLHLIFLSSLACIFHQILPMQAEKSRGQARQVM